MRIVTALLAIILVQTVTAQNLFPVEKKNKWGYMDENGKMVIDFKYDIAQNFNEGFAVVALNRMPCLINTKEKRVIDTGLYQYIGTFSEGLASVMDYKFKRYFLNNKSEVVLTLENDIYDAQPFYKGLARVGKKINIVQNKYGFDISNLGYKFTYIRKNGTYLTDFIFDDCDDFIDNPVRFMQGQKFGLLDTTGTIILKATYFNLSTFNEGLAVIDAGGKYGFINTQGQEVIKPTFEYVRMFNNGLAAFDENGKIGFINTKGEVIITPQYEFVRPFSENRAAVLVNGKWGLIDKTGKFIFNPQFDDAGYYSEGLCPVKMKKKWGAIDKEGRIVVPFEFESVGIFENGMAEVIYRGINLYVDRRGNILPK